MIVSKYSSNLKVGMIVSQSYPNSIQSNALFTEALLQSTCSRPAHIIQRRDSSVCQNEYVLMANIVLHMTCRNDVEKRLA